MSDLAASGLGVTYGELAAVNPLDLSVPGGRVLSVTGPSGAGK
jgi:putative ABC transport system ATP-binding protein